MFFSSIYRCNKFGSVENCPKRLDFVKGLIAKQEFIYFYGFSMRNRAAKINDVM